MKRTITIVALTALMLTACNNSIDDAEVRQDVHRLVSKTEQCYANVHNDLLDSLDVDYFTKCNDELMEMLDDIDKKYKNPKDRHKFDSTFFEEIDRSDLDNDIISMMQELYGMNEI